MSKPVLTFGKNGFIKKEIYEEINEFACLPVCVNVCKYGKRTDDHRLYERDF